MIKNSVLLFAEFIMTFTFLGYNLEIGSSVYNWLAALGGGFFFFAMMYYDPKIDNRAAIKMAFIGPSIAVVFAPLACEHYNIAFDRSAAKAIYMTIAFFGLVFVRIAYGLSAMMERDVAVLLWNIIKEKIFGNKTPPRNEN